MDMFFYYKDSGEQENETKPKGTTEITCQIAVGYIFTSNLVTA